MGKAPGSAFGGPGPFLFPTQLGRAGRCPKCFPTVSPARVVLGWGEMQRWGRGEATALLQQLHDPSKVLGWQQPKEAIICENKPGGLGLGAISASKPAPLSGLGPGNAPGRAPPSQLGRNLFLCAPAVSRTSCFVQQRLFFKKKKKKIYYLPLGLPNSPWAPPAARIRALSKPGSALGDLCRHQRGAGIEQRTQRGHKGADLSLPPPHKAVTGCWCSCSGWRLEHHGHAGLLHTRHLGATSPSFHHLFARPLLPALAVRKSIQDCSIEDSVREQQPMGAVSPGSAKSHREHPLEPSRLPSDAFRLFRLFQS